MFPWQLLITGAVGVGGTALGAWLNGRMQNKNLRLSLDAENKRARVAEKRRIYAACQSAFWRTNLAVTAQRGARSASEKEKAEALFSMSKALDSMLQTFNELLLIAPDSVTECANHVQRAQQIFLLTVEGDAAGDAQDMDNISQIQARLYEAMRADLGEPV
jgi:hypothetical protein